MKKLGKFLIAAFALFVFPVCSFASCGGEPQDEPPAQEQPGVPETPADPPSQEQPDTPETPVDPPKKDFEGIVFANASVDYDGQAHTIEASGMPADATVTYTNAGPYVNAGNYQIGVKVSKEGYNDFTATASLTINQVDFTGITFDGASFEYDGTPHSITVSGSLPATATIVYSCNQAGITNAATEIGSYVITAVISEKNHNTLTLQATLTITANDKERFMAYANGDVLYFQNAMDDNEFYAYDVAADAIVRVSGENAVDIVPYANDQVMYVSKTALITSLKKATVSNGSVETESLLTSANMRYVQASGNIAYYVVNGLTNEQSGIYKTDFSGSDPVTTCLSVGKAHYLQLVGSYLYFADGANGNKLSRISISSTSATRTLLVDAKINNLVYDNGALYYTVNNLLGDYIEKFTISSSVRRKLTMDAGTALTVVGDTLYYVNVDKITTNFVGNGIYSVSTSPMVDNNLPGKQVIDGGEMGVCSLETDGENLYYYDVNGYKLMQYNLSTERTKNLLEGFTKPEDATPINTGSKMQVYEGNIYYLDIWDSKTLHCYNPITKQNYALTTNKVVDFSIVNDTLYVNMVSYLLNNDSYMVNLKTGGSLVEINHYSAFEFISHGGYIYYVEENAIGVRTAVHQCKPDGSEDIIVYDKGVEDLHFIDGKLYFVEGYNIHCLDLQTKEDTTVKVDGREIHTTEFDTDGTYLYYRDMYGVAWLNKRLTRCKPDGTENVIMVTDIDPVKIVYQDGKVYYYSDTTSTAKNGLFYVAANVTAETKGTALVAESTGRYAKEFVVLGNQLYFVDYKTQLVGDSHLYVMTIGADVVTRIQ